MNAPSRPGGHCACWPLAAAVLALALPAAALDDPAMLRFSVPTHAETPIGISRIEVDGRALLPGDRLELFVDGRRAGAVYGPPWALQWDFGEAPRQHSLTAVLMRDGIEVTAARMKTRSLGVVTAVSSRIVGLSMTVTDGRGRPVPGLKKEDFTVLEDGRPQVVETLESAGSKLSVVLVLDLSASMLPKLGDARQSVLRFLDALSPGDEVSLLTFNSQVLAVTPFSADRSLVKHAIQDVVPSGETALYDATAAALKKLKAAKGRRAVVLFTDGEDNRSRLGANQVIEMARAGEATIFAVAQGHDESKVLKVYLDRMAAATGGRSYFVATVKTLGKAFDDVLAEMKSQYFLTYQPSATAPKTWRQVEVRARTPGISVRTRPGYFYE